MNYRRKGRLAGVVAIVLMASALCAQGFTVVLSAVSTYGFTANGAALPMGSIVMIFGSLNSTPDMPQSIGTNYIADSVTGDDVFIGYTTVLEGNYIEVGGFTYESTMVNYLYLRFFDTKVYPVEGFYAWGTTDVWGVTNNSGFPYAEVDFAPTHPYNAGHSNNFVVIPEPSTGRYFLTAALFAFGVHLLGLKHNGKVKAVRVPRRIDFRS